MTVSEIKAAVDSGKKVKWANDNYDVIKDPVGNGFQWLIFCSHNQHAIGLTWKDGVTLNGKENDFYIEGEK